MKQWLRVVRANINGKEFTNDDKKGIDIDFERSFSTEKEDPDTSKIILYNLSRSTINSFKKNGLATLSAGYLGSVGNIISGTIADVSTEFTPTTKTTTVIVKEGTTKWKDSTFIETYEKGVDALYIINELIEVLSLRIGQLDIKNIKVYPRGKSVKGSAKNSLISIVKETGAKMFIKGDRVFISDDVFGEDTGYLINAKSGLITTPVKNIEEVTDEKTDKTIERVTYTFDCQLHHMLDKNNIVRIQSKSINGDYRIIKGSHNGNSFITNLEVEGV